MKTIDMTPTWAGILTMLLTVYEDGNPDGRRNAFEELTRMARLADLYVAGEKAGTIKAQQQ